MKNISEKNKLQCKQIFNFMSPEKYLILNCGLNLLIYNLRQYESLRQISTMMGELVLIHCVEKQLRTEIVHHSKYFRNIYHASFFCQTNVNT